MISSAGPPDRIADRVDWICFGLVPACSAMSLRAGAIGYAAEYTWANVWNVFFMGAGWVALLGTAVGVSLPAFRKGLAEWLILSCLLLGVGHQDKYAWTWPVVTAILAVVISLKLVRGRFRA